MWPDDRTGHTERYEDINVDDHVVASKLASLIKGFHAGLFNENHQ
jgi:hypothetical protein